MENEDLVEKNVVNSPNAKKMEVGTDDLQREKEKELPSVVESLNIAEETPNLQHAKEGEEMHGETRALESLNITEEVPNLSHDKEGERSQIVETRELESLNDEQNPKLHHEKEGEGSHDQSIETRELGSLNAEQNPNLHDEKEGEGSHDQSVETRELESLNAEQNPNLHYGKEGEGSHDQPVETRELESLNADQNANIQHDKGREASHDQSVETRELESLNAEQNANLQHDKGREASHDQSVETREPESLTEQNPNLHYGKGGEGSHDQPVETRELESLNAEQNASIQHDKGREASHDLSVETRELESLNAEQNAKVQHDKGGEGSHDQSVETREMESLNAEQNAKVQHEKGGEVLHDQSIETIKDELENQEPSQSTEKTIEEEQEPVFDGTEIPEGNAWPEKAAAIKNFVREKSVVAVSSMLRRLSGRKNEIGQNLPDGEEKDDDTSSNLKGDSTSSNLKEDSTSSNLKEDSTSSNVKGEDDSTVESKPIEDTPKTVERSLWNPLSYIKSSKDADTPNKEDQVDDVGTEELPPPPTLKGRIILYTRLGCQDCKEVRLLLHRKMLRYVEINIDVYPGRKSELEKYTGSSSVPKVFFNEIPVGGLSELLAMEESGHFDEKVKELITEEPSSEAPIPPLSGEDDLSCSGAVDDLAVIVAKMKETILVKDRFYKMRRITNCFLASEAIDFLSQNQDLERQEAIEFARKLVSKKFFKHVLDENVFEDGNQLYRFLDQDPIVSSQCHNISRGITDVKPKSLTEIASRLRFLSFAIFEAYTSEDGKHINYRSIHGSEEFARYLRVVEELQRVDLEDLSREEKLAFFINLFNMMAIHAILLWGYPAGALERRKTLGDFKYVVGGCTYSLSAIQNGILRGNQRPPYNITKPFGAKDSRSKIALSYAEPLIHFALVCGNKSGPALRCYSPGDIDKELMEAARNFLRNGGIIVDPETKVVTVSKILKWYSVDFGKNENEVLKHASNYLEPEKSAELLELLASNQLKVIYQAYDWGVNC